MSIFNKVLLLFSISLILMLFVSSKTDALTQSTIETLLKKKYIEVSDELFKALSNSDTKALDERLQTLQFMTVSDKQHYFDNSKIIYDYSTERSTIKILQHEDNIYLLYLKYLDDDILVMDRSQDKSIEDKTLLNYLIGADITILIMLFLIILKMMYPLKEIVKSIKKFGEGDHSVRIKKVKDDEIGEVASTFNAMATNIEALITSRQMLLRDISHELKTPISKSRLAIEMIDESTYQKILKRAIDQMDDLTNELLFIERFNANQYTLDLQTFSVETLIGETLSRLFIEDESLITIDIKVSFSLTADLKYLSIALKNLVDNALKYGSEKPLFIEVKDHTISVRSRGERLERAFDFYCEEFTQGDDSRTKSGFGLGLSLVNRILKLHGFGFSYKFEKGYNIFSIEV